MELYTTEVGRTPSRDVEEKLLSAAEEILAQEGPSGLTVRSVATAAGIAPMGVYNRFEGKHGLLEALFVKGCRQLQATIAAADGPDAYTRLRDSCLRYRQFALHHPQHYRLMFERMHEVEPGPEALQEAFLAFEHLVRLVARARERQTLGRGSDVDVAQQIWSSLHGAVSLELLGIGFSDDPATTYAELVDALLTGLTETATSAASRD